MAGREAPIPKGSVSHRRSGIHRAFSHIAHKRRNVRFKRLRRVHTPPQPLTAHTAAHTAKHGAFQMGALSLPSERSARSQTSPGRVSEWRTLPLFGLDLVYSRRMQRACGTAMRSCASLSRGVAAPLGCATLFSVCLCCIFHARRTGISACAKWRRYHHPRRIPHIVETPGARLSK